MIRKQQYQNINEVLQQLPAKVLHTAVVSHYNSESAEKKGKRFAKKMKRLQKQLKNANYHII
jgi:hypothetical protein